MTETSYNLLVLAFPVLVPLTLAAITAILWRNIQAQRVVAIAGLGVIVVCSVLLTMAVLRYDILAVEFGSWAVPFGISFVADRFAAALVMITGVLAFCVGIFSLRDMRQIHMRAGFYPLFFGMVAGVNGAFLTGDLFNLYVWFEVMLITSLGLLVIGRTKAQIDGAIKYALLNLLGTVLFLMAIGLLYGAAGTLAFADLARVLPTLEPTPGLVGAAILFLCAFGIKAGVFPLFFWLPASYHTAPFTISAIFAGLLTKVGVYAAFRVFTLLFTVEESGIREIVAVVAALTMVTGVFGAAVQWNIRRILSFHIISQIGYILMGLAIATPLAIAGAVFYIVHHIIVKANLFLLAGAIRQASGTDDLKKSGGLLKSHPWLAVLFLIPALSLAGLPPAVRFLGEVPGRGRLVQRRHGVAGCCCTVYGSVDALLHDQNLDGSVLESTGNRAFSNASGPCFDGRSNRHSGCDHAHHWLLRRTVRSVRRKSLRHTHATGCLHRSLLR
jgi:multicomponent Na+:H+ antiporter subunit D